MAKSYKKRGKMPALITYIIAVVFLIAGLTLPLQTSAFKGGGIQFGNMPFLQLTGALATFGLFKGGLTFGKPLAHVFSLGLFGGKFNLGATLLLLYALITLVCVVMLIPLCIMKKKSEKPKKIISVLECLAITVLLSMCALAFTRPASEWNLSVFAALGVTGLMLVLQSIIYFGKSGVIKTVTLLLSSIAVLFAVANAADNLPFLTNPINKLVNAMQGKRPFETTAALYSLNGVAYYGSTVLKLALKQPSALAHGVGMGIVNYTALALTALVCLNLFLNALGLAKRTNKFMVVCNFIRYIAEIVLLLVIYISVFTTAGSYGLGLYLLTLLALTQFIISIVRLVRYKKLARALKLAEETDEDADTPDTDEEYAFDDVKPAAARMETREMVYNVNTIYNGPADSFIRKLTNEEKVEFARVFLERSSENLLVLPEYIVGGENSKFFSAVFIYLARVRSVVSDGLMNKLYNEAIRLNG